VNVSGPDNEQNLQRLAQLSLTAWELEQDNVPDADKRGAVALRAHARLQAEIEAKLGVARDRRTRIGLQDETGEGVLLIHGSTGSPSDLDELARHLHGAGYTVYNMLLPGHGYESGAMPDVQWRSCFNEVMLRYALLRKYCTSVHLVGFSFGASLAILAAQDHTPATLSLLAPALVPRLPFGTRLLLALGLHHLPFVHRRVGWDMEVYSAMERARGRLGKLHMPVYAAQCQDDPRIDASSLRIVQKKIHHKGSRFRLFPEGGHMILEAHGRSVLNTELTEFLSGRKRG
jgi:esterase/lipase